MAEQNKPENAEYGADQIQVLEGLEAVRKRPGMYIGSTGERGLHHLVYEIVDNCVDEALAGYASRIEVTILADGGVRVTDDGRGIPVDPQTTGTYAGMSTLEMILTVLHAGGKFGGGGYAVSGGLHGVGSSVVNALSSRLVADVQRQGFNWKMSFANGVPQGPIEKGEAIPEEQTGTTITFWASPDTFETVVYNFETLRARFQQMAFLNKGLRIVFRDERADSAKVDLEAIHDVEDDEESAASAAAEQKLQDSSSADDAADSTNEEAGQNAGDETVANLDAKVHTVNGAQQVEYCYKNGIVDYVDHINKLKKNERLNDEIVYFETEDKEKQLSLEVALQWTTAYKESIYSYANTITTTEGGTHLEGFQRALTALVNKYAREKNILKEKDENLTGEDSREGLTAVISIKLGEPQFEGQTKTKLGNTAARAFVSQNTSEKLSEWFEENPKEAKNILEKAISAATARQAAKKAKEAVQRKSVFESGGMPDKLKDCQSNSPEESEIFIVEGDSAGGSAINGRNPYNQAILPLRGKILNVEKVRIDRAMASDTIQSLVSAIGTGTGGEFDADKCRYHKIVLMADADVDGAHICTLLLTFLFRFMPELITRGYVYMAQPPLYRIKWSKGHAHEFVFSDDERDEHVRHGQEQGWNLPSEGVQRYKGLGEMRHEELWETTMDPSRRTLKVVEMEDAAAADEVFNLLMGEEVPPRRAFIQQNAKDVRFLDI